MKIIDLLPNNPEFDFLVDEYHERLDNIFPAELVDWLIEGLKFARFIGMLEGREALLDNFEENIDNVM